MECATFFILIVYNQVVTQVYAWLRTYSTLELALRIGVRSTNATCSRATQASIHGNINRSGWIQSNIILLVDKNMEILYFSHNILSGRCLNHCCAGIYWPVATQDLQDMRHDLKLIIYCLFA